MIEKLRQNQRLMSILRSKRFDALLAIMYEFWIFALAGMIFVSAGISMSTMALGEIGVKEYYYDVIWTYIDRNSVPLGFALLTLMVAVTLLRLYVIDRLFEK